VASAARADRSQERFYAALRDLFVGAAVEGQSGFINLMRIKSRYYEGGVFPKLQKDIDSALKSLGHDPNVRHSGSCPQTDSFRQELFDKLYDFFHRCPFNVCATCTAARHGARNR